MTDGGLETELIFSDGIELPLFASFLLLKDEAGIAALQAYYQRYLSLARTLKMGLVLETPTWRANADWGKRLGYGYSELEYANRKAVHLLEAMRGEFERGGQPLVVSGNLGPRGDGYRADTRMSVTEAYDYHFAQMRVFAGSGADMAAAFTMNYSEEAIGVALAAKACEMPVAISFTVETDGTLPSGEGLQDALEATDRATGEYPIYYMINCAHPSHFLGPLKAGGEWLNRVRGVRANASRRSHAELDESTELDPGNPAELGGDYRVLRQHLRGLAVVGGCCGTDSRHVGAICRALLPTSP